jgi:hypothetical protein
MYKPINPIYTAQALNRLLTSEFVDFGPTPSEEQCTAFRADLSHETETMILECDAYAQQLERMFPNAPKGCWFAIQKTPYEEGSYYDVICIYDTTLYANESREFVTWVQTNAPENWDAKAIEYLRQHEHPLYFTAHRIKKTA